MIPSIGDIMRRRATAVSVMRGGSVFSALCVAVPLLSWVFEGLSDGDFFELGYYSGRIAVIIVLLMLSLACVVLARPVSKWIVPMHEPRCPRCDHLLSHLVTPRCSECGLRLPDELVQEDTHHIEPPPRP